MPLDIGRFNPLNIPDDPEAPVVYVVDSAEHPFDIAGVATKAQAAVVSIPVSDWNDSLTPWPAAGFYESDPEFGGHGGETLRKLIDEAIPGIESRLGIAPKRRAICGYSLGGLFALYAFVDETLFDACACISGSLWYEGWMEHIRQIGPKEDAHAGRRFAFLSVGKKERKSGLPLFRCVEDNMMECSAILAECGCETSTVVGPGNHMQHIDERFGKAFEALDSFLFGTPLVG